jgi:iron complex outermembrane receptor protein
VTDNVAVSFTGGYKSRDGVGSFVNLPNAGIEVGETKEVFARAALRFAPSDDFSLTIAADMNDGEGGLRPYTTLIDELPNGAVYGAGYRNSDVAANPYDNNTGQGSQTLVTNQAEGISLTADWNWNDDIGSKVIVSHRSSEYKAGLDDDGFIDDFLSFPEFGEADQTSFEFQVNGDLGAFDFVSGIYYFNEDGKNNQDPTIFLSFPGSFYLAQEVTSTAIFANVGFDVSDQLRLSGGIRFNNDEKDAETDVGIGLFTNSDDWDEVMWELAANYTFDNGMSAYGAIQNGYQSGQFPARPFCLFGDPNCFVAGDNITATNFEVGIKGQPTDRLQVSAAVFFTQYKDLPYQVSTTQVGGFQTLNEIVDQDSTGIEVEATWLPTDNFSLHVSLGTIDVSIDSTSGIPLPTAVAPLTPELTYAISPEFSIPLASGAEVTLRLDHSFRDDMWGEPTNDPGRLTKIDSRALTNIDIAWHSSDGTFTAGIYGRNVSDERYDNARLNTGDYILQILSNDPSEFGLRLVKSF